MNAHRLANTAGPTNLAGAIYSAESRITIKNGAIRGFAMGVGLYGSFFDDSSKANGPALIRRNWITGAESNPPTAISTAMFLEGDGTRVIDNDILGVTAPPGGTGFGIYVTGADALIVNNRITDSDVGVQLPTSGKYRDNLTSSVTYPYLGGIDAGNNN